MPKLIAPLSARAVAVMNEPGFYAVGGVPGLHLDVSPSGSRNWVYKYQITGVRRSMGLGSARDHTLAQARERAGDARKLVLQGIDPIDQRRDQRVPAPPTATANDKTFKYCAEEYIRTHRSGWKNTHHANQWVNSLETYVYPLLGDLPVDEINTNLVMQALTPIWHAKTETADRVRNRIELVLSWAGAQGYRDGEKNPARWKGLLSHLLPSKTHLKQIVHHRALPYEDAPSFMAALREQQTTGARPLELLLLTAKRANELLPARWEEFDEKTGVWTIPAERMKGRKNNTKEYREPLSSQALELIARLSATKNSKFVFPGMYPSAPVTLSTIRVMITRMGYRDVVTPHGLRSCFRDWVSEATEFHYNLAEVTLAHKIDSKVAGAYRRGDMLEKRRTMMEAWGRYLSGETLAKAA